MNNGEREVKGGAAAWSFLGSFVLVVLLAWKLGGFRVLIPDLIALVSGSAGAITNGADSLLGMLPTIMAAVAISLPCTITGGVIAHLLTGGLKGKHAVRETLRVMVRGNHFATFFLLVLGEEIFARQLFLGWLPKLPFLSGPVAFYGLFFAGNLIWAVFGHISNFQNQEDRNPIRTLPQIIGGVVFTAVFVKYGLLASTLTHFSVNAVLLSTDKVQKTNLVDGLIVVYAGVVGCVGAAVMLLTKTSPSSLVPWFSITNPHFVIEGWGFWHYLIADLTVGAAFSLAFGLLLYDRGSAGRYKVGEEAKPLDPPPPMPEIESWAEWVGIMLGLILVSLKGCLTLAIKYILGPIVAVGVIYGLYFLLGFITPNVPYRVLGVAIVYTFFKQDVSGSSIARTFWTTLPGIFLTICAMQALGNFWVASLFLAVETVLMYPQTLFLKFDD